MTMIDNLSKLKILLGIDTSDYDTKLELVWDLLTAQVLAYLGRQGNALPPGLEAIILQMAVDYLSQNNTGIAAIGVGDLKSVQRGDTTITYNVADAASAGAFISLYNDLLWPFKRVIMR